MYYTSPEVYEFISKKTNDPIIERKTCRISGTKFPVFQSDLDFYKKISPNFPSPTGEGLGVRSYPIPTPTLCPEERQRRRLIFRNERKLYRRKCDASGRSIISIYSPNSPYTVYDQKIRWSDSRDALDYGKVFDFEKSFTEQFGELMREVPQTNTTNFNNENSDYANYLNDSKNCYFTFGSGFLEDSYFCNWSYECKNAMETSYCFRGEISYENIACEGFYKCMFCINTKNSSNCKYCYSCDNCKNCIGCINLVGKSFCIFNKQHTKEEYNKKIKNIAFDNRFKKEFFGLASKFFKKSTHTTDCKNTFANDVKKSKNIIGSFEVDISENCKYCREVIDQKNNMDVNNYGYSDLAYEIMGFGYSNKVAFTLYSAYVNNLLYCAFCQNGCSFCFGCVGLKNKKYCIFNKQYTEEEYNNLVPKIIEHMIKTGEWGEFFDPSISPFGYNETVAQEYFPCKISEDGKQIISVDGSVSFKRQLQNNDEKSSEIFGKNHLKSSKIKRQDKNYDPVVPENMEVLKGDQIPSDITQVQNDILRKVIICEVSGRPFKLIKQELDFYRKHNLPLPRKHPDIRHQERLQKRSPRELHLRVCDKCNKEMISVYPKDGNTEKVYCESCYKTEIYG